MSCRNVIVVEYSPDMSRYARWYGGSLSMDGHTVEYKQVDGSSILRFRINGSTYGLSEFRYLVNYVLRRR